MRLVRGFCRIRSGFWPRPTTRIRTTGPSVGSGHAVVQIRDGAVLPTCPGRRCTSSCAMPVRTGEPWKDSAAETAWARGSEARSSVTKPPATA